MLTSLELLLLMDRKVGALVELHFLFAALLHAPPPSLSKKQQQQPQDYNNGFQRNTSWFYEGVIRI